MKVKNLVNNSKTNPENVSYFRVGLPSKEVKSHALLVFDMSSQMQSITAISILFFVSLTWTLSASLPSLGLRDEEAAAVKYLIELDIEQSQKWNQLVKKGWSHETNMTDASEKESVSQYSIFRESKEVPTLAGKLEKTLTFLRKSRL